MRRRRLGGYPACRGDEEEVERLPVLPGGHKAAWQAGIVLSTRLTAGSGSGVES